MFLFNKFTQTALAAMGHLAEAYGCSALNSLAIAHASHLPQPMVAKVLSILARSGLVMGLRGPGGGYRLVRSPNQIYLDEIISLFERRLEIYTRPRPCCHMWSKGKPGFTIFSA